MKLSTILRLSSLFAIGTAKAVDLVDCVSGLVRETSSGQTCEEACNDGADCCGPAGANACFGFTGKVAKDGSCMGDDGKMCECPVPVQFLRFGNESCSQFSCIPK